MSLSRGWWAAALVLACCSGGGSAWAGGPWDKLLTASRVEADPQKSYALTEQNLSLIHISEPTRPY